MTRWCLVSALLGIAAFVPASAAATTDVAVTALASSGCPTLPGPMPAPRVVSFSPAGGPAGTKIIVKGTGLGTTTSVTVGGIAAVGYYPVSPTTLRVTVPRGGRTGHIAVRTDAGMSVNSKIFTVTGVTTKLSSSIAKKPAPAILPTAAEKRAKY